MDYVTRQVINLTKKLRDDVRKAASNLHNDLARLANGLKNLKDAINTHRQADEKSYETPPVTIAELRTQIPIRVKTETERSHTEAIWRVVKGALETFGIVAVILYTIFAYQQWQEMITANEVSMSNFRRARIDANGQLKGLQAQIEIAGQELGEIRRQARVEHGAFFTATTEIDRHVIMGKPVTGAATIVNVGKSEAREVRADVVLTKIRNGDKIVFSYDLSHTILLNKIVNPNESNKLETNWSKIITPSQGVPIIPTQKDVDEFSQGIIFFMLYGRITYKDVFGVHHWLHFCGFMPGIPGRFHARECTDYNDTDDN